DALRDKKILFHESCKDCIREFALYSWDCKGTDNPQKENDHAMDDVRYFVAYAMEKENDGFFVASLKR
ncbi:MAG TPA: PBSX family phage terminase large subunit, partial [Oscillospiraceae bacterium]|nr:PBSX family phage terminase large subunit [Oscillospiraceae bacterium]